MTNGSVRMNGEAHDGGTLEAALGRLEQALQVLEHRVAQARDQAQAASRNAEAEAERARLAAELEVSRNRERELEIAGSLASQALGRAIADLRAALGETES